MVTQTRFDLSSLLSNFECCLSLLIITCSLRKLRKYLSLIMKTVLQIANIECIFINFQNVAQLADLRSRCNVRPVCRLVSRLRGLPPWEVYPGGVWRFWCYAPPSQPVGCCNIFSSLIGLAAAISRLEQFRLFHLLRSWREWKAGEVGYFGRLTIGFALVLTL